jgi:hypothetical protein
MCVVVGWAKGIGAGEGPERARSHCGGTVAARRIFEASGIRSKRCCFESTDVLNSWFICRDILGLT